MVFKHINVVAAIENICASFEEMIREKKITLTRDLPDEICIHADQQLFKQLFKQLLDNAVKFTEHGGVTVRSKTVKENEFLWQTIMIEDTGVGIEKEHFERIFQEFRQVSEGYGRKFQGNGLGLAISKKICELMNGKITLESTPGKGTTFTIWLPATHSEIQATVRPVELKPSAGLAPAAKKKDIPVVLLVEDNQINRNLIELFLKPGYIMDHAFEGKTAVQMARERKYDAILMDINLGTGIDGTDATKMIRAIPGYENTPIIAVTGYTMIGDREKLLAEGCTHYIAKPFEKAAFLAIVKEAIYGPGKAD
jgi:CheY-like chemotaxis protein